MVLVSLISNFFTNKTSLANKWMSFSSSNSALVTELLLKCYGANASREENTSKSKAVGNGHTKPWPLGTQN